MSDDVEVLEWVHRLLCCSCSHVVMTTSRLEIDAPAKSRIRLGLGFQRFQFFSASIDFALDIRYRFVDFSRRYRE